nr:hypothetical protein [uncultured bacterium]
MSGFVSSLFFFVLAIGILVTVHEYGHFIVARALGVRVLRFSIGFGKPLWIRRAGSDGTEFAIAALPLGGYVQMLDEREGPVAEHERHRAFNRQTLARRAAIVAAGPFFNFLLAIVAYWLVLVVGVAGVKPVVGDVAPGSVAEEGGFRTGDRIVTIAGRSVETWNNAFLELLDRSLARARTPVEVVGPGGTRQERILDFSRLGANVDRSNLLENIGFDLYRPVLPPVIGQVEPHGAAAAAGLQAGDRIVKVDGRGVESWDEWVTRVRGNPDRPLAVEIERDGQRHSITVTPERVETREGVIGRIGAAVDVPADFGAELRTVERYSVFGGLSAATERTWEMTRLTLEILGNMVTGHVALANLGGPIRIAQYAGSSAGAGVVQYVSFIALISISLGVLNLLPVPILDGGHLLYYLIEFVKGSPLSEQAQSLGQRIGMVFLVGMMILAFYNDIVQLVG